MKEMLMLLRNAVCNNATLDTESLTQRLPQAFALAKKYDLANVLVYGCEKASIKNDAVADAMAREKSLAIFRVTRLNFATEQVCGALSEARVPYILLKGARMRELYPEEWLRTSCDIDIYVDTHRLDDATSALEALGYVKGRRHIHDVMLTATNGCTVELHFVLTQNNDAKMFEGIWNKCQKTDAYRYEMSDELFYYFHISHMARHMKSGGCGMRPFLDLWLLRQRNERAAERRELCRLGGLEAFERYALALSDMWFSGIEADKTVKLLEEYILSGAMYGTASNAASASGRTGYIISRIFMPYSQMKLKYPTLEKRPYLLPFYTVKRWCNLFNPTAAAASTHELRASTSVSEEDIKKYRSLFKRLEL